MRETSNSLSKQNSQQPKQFRGGEKKVMKKSLSLLVAIAMVFSMFAAVASAAEKQTAGEYLQEIGVIKGNLEGNLNEDKEWKREDLTVLLSRLLGVEKAASEHANTHGFTDVTNSFYDGFISWAKKEGLMIGKTETTFGYNAPLTNQHFAAVVLRALKIEAEYNDVPKVAVEKKLVAEGTDFTANALRGATYEVIVTALNTEVTGTGKKLGTILGLKGFEIKELVLDEAKATSRANVVLDFNAEVGDAKATNFTVYEKENKFATKNIDKVAVNGDKVTLTLIDNLTNDAEYVVEVNNLKTKAGDFTLDLATKEFKYVKQAAASIGFGKTTVAINSNVPVVIKDAQGNDITANYSIPADVEVQTSVDTIVDEDLKTTGNPGYAVVNAKLKDSELETGNTIITVKTTVNTVTSFGKVGVGNPEDGKLDVYVGQESQVLDYQVFDQNGDAVKKADLKEVTFRSSSPTVAVVNEAGGITALNTGTTNVTISVKGSDDRIISKVATLTVKAAPKATSLKVEPANGVRLVIGTTIAQTVKVEILDQYGNTFKPATTTITYSINRDKVAQGVDKDVVLPASVVSEGKAEIQLLPFEEVGKDTTATSGTLKVKFDGIEKSISVALVKAGSFAGYVAVAGDTTLDMNGNAVNDKNVKGPTSTPIKVYEKDVNGNYLKEVTATLSSSKNKEFVELNGSTVESKKPGTENVYVEVNNVRIATIGFTVVNTAKTLTTVTQSNNGVTVKDTADLANVLFGAQGDVNGGIFVGYDQYGAKFPIERNNTDVVQIISSNNQVIEGFNIKKAGEANLTLKIGDKFFSIVVKVVE